eukprot:GHVU01172344.1.p1 GENE.GHVU01172344.1~~GHVU01172344.1.p1  ORF type:complete len:101 (-),score=12.45 GHVU01172344.1:154-456(-)
MYSFIRFPTFNVPPDRRVTAKPAAAAAACPACLPPLLLLLMLLLLLPLILTIHKTSVTTALLRLHRPEEPLLCEAPGLLRSPGLPRAPGRLLLALAGRCV